MDETPKVRTNAEVREWYLEQVARIPELNTQWLEKGLSARERAARSWRLRRDARLKARAMMPNPADVQRLRDRDRAVYGDPNGPSFEYLVEKLEEAGLSGDAVYEAIVEGAYRTSRGFNKRSGL